MAHFQGSLQVHNAVIWSVCFELDKTKRMLHHRQRWGLKFLPCDRCDLGKDFSGFGSPQNLTCRKAWAKKTVLRQMYWEHAKLCPPVLEFWKKHGKRHCWEKSETQLQNMPISVILSAKYVVFREEKVLGRQGPYWLVLLGRPKPGRPLTSARLSLSSRRGVGKEGGKKVDQLCILPTYKSK